MTASYSDSGDGDLIGQPHCIAADPLFMNAAGGDWRLHYGSPCIDTGSPGSITALDLRGVTRNVDGNLDTQNAADMGAFEFQMLEKIGFVSIATDMGLLFWGPSGGSSTLQLSFSAPTAGTSTSFGTFYLSNTGLLTLGNLPCGSGPPGILRRHIPNNPSLIGTTFSFQALTDSPLAPSGRAYTNPISFVIAP